LIFLKGKALTLIDYGHIVITQFSSPQRVEVAAQYYSRKCISWSNHGLESLNLIIEQIKAIDAVGNFR
jgi:hypothetical protein